MNTWIETLNSASEPDAQAMLDGLFEHSPWVVHRALAMRPFVSVAHLKHAFTVVVAKADANEQTALLLAHPELAGRAAIAGELTDASLTEQTRSGLQSCSPEEFAAFHELNREYRERFGWPFILAIG
ncbi:MAG: 2-oxo-4-hydroxy-4-carboxy-5-ureidoimidazoline decarboxylase, partial [Oxalobacteraceae bacterium]|nr:2-oxo-4-hydroxy-4-carboxy-5-ureidoimidazoline decarboxylase [Oxalobacteraceae bacterium]